VIAGRPNRTERCASSTVFESGVVSSSTTYGRGAILRGVTAGMGSTKAVIIGYLTITVPTILLVGLTIFYGYYMYGGPWFYTLAGVAVGWRWYSFALGRWKRSLSSQRIGEGEIDALAASSGLEWPGATQIGSWSLHTAAACMCALHLSPWLVGRWFAWGIPLTGHTTQTYGADAYLQHLEVVTIIPAFAVGYFASYRFRKFGELAWLLPTLLLAYRIVTFPHPSSVLATTRTFPFTYFFSIEPYMPTFRDSRGADVLRVYQQMFVVAPFYASVAYSLGSVALRYFPLAILKEKQMDLLPVEVEVEASSDTVAEKSESSVEV
jgi:hypothetical protein